MPRLLIFDSSGNKIWSVNVVVGDEDETFVTGSLPLTRYARTKAGKSNG